MKKVILIISVVLCVVVAFSPAKVSAKPKNLDSLMQVYGLIDVRTFDSTILVELKYATTDNFVGEDMYKGLKIAYVQPEIARMVADANAKLKRVNSHYRLLILDAARPMSVQKYMHDLVAGTPQHIYVANPNTGGGRHNYGVAVDATVVKLTDRGAQWLDMGSGFDDFRPESHLDARDKDLITVRQSSNRMILIDLMRSVGFGMISSEWWHFQKYSMSELPGIYRRLDF